jgi:hypothetical protein
MTTTQQIVNQFTEIINTENEYTRAELSKILTLVYHETTTQKKSYNTDKEPKKKAKKNKDSDEEPKKNARQLFTISL